MTSQYCYRTYVVYTALFVTGALCFYLFKHKKNTVLHKAEQIYNVLDQYRITYDIDARSVDPTHDTTPKPITGTHECVQQIARFVAQEKPINMLVVSFPFKSRNHEKKTVGDLPDMAERKSLEYMQEILEKIKTVYQPGAQLTVFCDGIAFAQFLDISQPMVLAYEKTLKQLGADLPNITFYTSTDFMHDHKLTQLDDINTVIDACDPGNAALQASIKPVVGIARKRFALEFDYHDGEKILAHQTLDEIVFGILQRENRLRTYLSKAFPAEQFLRLTVHFSGDVSKKFGVKLSPDSDITPYHGVLVEDKEPNAWSIQFKKDVDPTKYTLVTKTINGVNCPFFKRNF